MIQERTKVQTYLQIHPNDNVLVALQDLLAGTTVITKSREVILQQPIGAKHKFFVNDMKAGDEVIMYGTLVGKVQVPVSKGELMTTANTKHAAESYAYKGFQHRWQQPDVSKFKARTFNGYKRSDGRVGTANYWLFIPTVFCENRNLDVIKEALHKELGYAVSDKYNHFTRQVFQAFKEGKDIEQIDLGPSSNQRERYFKNIDGIKFLNHQGGCGGTRQDASTLSSLLAAYADHPNVGGVTVLSLGCQHLQVEYFLADLKKRNPSFDKPLYVFEQQQSQSEEELICNAIKKTFLGLAEINKIEREPAPLRELTIGVKCGGSDGFSGISANPAVGCASDLLVALGGKVLLAEFPELCGAEQELIDRCVNESVAEKFIHLMESYNDLAKKVGSGFHMNPSPGNIKDGLITDAIKSTGAARKGGTSPVVDVLDYTEPVTKPGLSLVCTPGNDVEATTGKAASGATLILFTTGLGTPTGNPVAPTVKISTNTGLASRMSDIIDIDTGGIIRGEKTIEQMGEEILEYCIKAASGEIIPKAVLLGQDDFIPWKRGVSL
ncbi:UxaA family hydrolase [Flavisolibacter ginsenosidimutans]|uniref:Altronate dehydratase n=1 Tax=Flavisolibacter ginsenosidimutans TaxID=661481 RepID=A0A5B8UIC5_9BACT|nr:altronate dehydratase family protein [Flavisolibacter ginsenosidimutans]QEC56126.1 altronate dehydratase [Flavisolibacter ginsenosidimutans]